MRIVIVDDDPANLFLIQHMVQGLEEGDPVTFTHPVEALAWCEQNVPDMVLVDYMMPEIDGLEFLRRFRGLDALADVPIVMITSAGTRDVRQKALELGASDFISKPMDRAEFVARARNMLALGASRRALADRAAWLADEVEKATAELRQSEERYALAARGSNDGLWDWNLETDEIYLSPRCKAMLGYAEDELSSTPAAWFDRIHPEDVERVRSEIHGHCEGGSEFLQSEYRMKHRSGEWIHVLSRGVVVCDPGGKATRMAGSQTDVTDRKRAEEQMLHDAFHDALTGLPNRALFMDRLGQAVQRTRRRRTATFAVMFLDIDRFKLINDSLGHKAGDDFLKVWSERVTATLRPSDTLARMGGDVFCILLEDVVQISDSTAAAKRLNAALTDPFTIAGTELYATVSVGIAMGSPTYKSAEDLLRDADVALHQAKAGGAGRFQVFEQAMHEGALERFELETDLRRAVHKGNELVLYYQPIVRLDTLAIVGFEALLRWRHPRRGLVLPGDFIPIAEDAGLIVPIGDFVVREASRQLEDWDEKFAYGDTPADGRPHLQTAPYIAVNLSTRQFRDPAHIQNLLDRIGGLHDNRRLQLEITESLLMDKPEQVAELLRKMKEMGARISIDDFGTGYSSLSYLHRFPIDILKVDRAFVGLIVEGDSNIGIVRAIISLGHELGMNVVAEGVETSRQCYALRDLGCEFGQGYYFSHPVPGADATELIMLAAVR
ncbi:MAG: EAL domain-containing protein [Armatimonadetes bacterium]|nr:EAL domain-containing protein [Armatimonadota bacterium]